LRIASSLAVIMVYAQIYIYIYIYIRIHFGSRCRLDPET